MLAKIGDNATKILARVIFGNSGKYPEISKTPRVARRPLATVGSSSAKLFQEEASEHDSTDFQYWYMYTRTAVL